MVAGFGVVLLLGLVVGLPGSTGCNVLLGLCTTLLLRVLCSLFLRELPLPQLPLATLFLPPGQPGLFRQRGSVSFVLGTNFRGNRGPAAFRVQTDLCGWRLRVRQPAVRVYWGTGMVGLWGQEG